MPEQSIENLASRQDLAEKLPFNLEAEQSVLGAVLIDSSCLPAVMEYVKPDSFYKPSHRVIFASMVRLFTAGLPVDFVTVLEAVKNEREFDSEDSAKIYLTQLAQIVPSVANVETYARIVQEKFYVRNLMVTAHDILDSAADSAEDAGHLLDAAEQRIYDIRQGRDSRGLRKIDEIIVESYSRLQMMSSDHHNQNTGLPTGYPLLDNMIFGLNKSDLLIIAGRPGSGKSSLAINMAQNIALKYAPEVDIAIFSLEMSGEQLVTRMLSSEARIDNSAFRTGRLAAEEWVRLASAADVLSRSNIYIDDTSGITVQEIKARLRRMKNLGLVVIDYLQLMTNGGRKGDGNRVQEVSEMTRNLKIMAKDLDVPVITLSQLSRSPDSRTDHRPMLSDLRESGSIEQDADIVMFIYRDSYYNEDSEEPNVAECIVAKNRHGETGTVKMLWEGEYTHFGNLELYRNEP